jgi:hypothetical protein
MAWMKREPRITTLIKKDEKEIVVVGPKSEVEKIELEEKENETDKL